MSHVLILIAAPGSLALTPSLLERVRAAAGAGAPRILSPGVAAELPCPAPPDAALVQNALSGAAVDIAILPAEGRRKRLLIADMDSTIVTGETLDELAAFAGVGDEVAAITRRSMNGELDFADALRARVALLRGLPVDALEQTWAGVRLMPGARTLVRTMQANGAVTALVSGGFTWFTSRVGALCGFDVHRSNTLLDDGAVLLGQVSEPILDRSAKLATLRELAAAAGLDLQDCLAVGDGANDLDMIGAAGLGVAYRAKPIVAAQARARVVHGDLRALLYMQGYAETEFLD
jgi:phosphoserine phosphatase